MNKKKSLLLVILSLIAAFTLAFAFGCKDNVDPDDEVLTGNYEGDSDETEAPTDAWVLQSITLDTAQIKTEYAYGEDFDTTQKPVVSAKLASVESLLKYEETKLLVTGAAELEIKTETVTDIKVDYGQYNKNAVGTYNIYVTYTHAGVTRAASYEVTVVGTDPAIGGITVEVAPGFETLYYIENANGVTISNVAEHIRVYNVDENLVVDKEHEVSAKTDTEDGYTLSYYRYGQPIDNLEGLQKGTYTVYVTYNNTSAFIVIEILDPVTQIVLKADNADAKFEQVQSPVDELTPSWIFEVTYRSGAIKDVKKGDAGLIIGSPVTVVPTQDSVTVSYTEDGETQSVTVSYTITADDTLTNETRSFSYAAITGISKDQQAMTSADMTGVNEFISIVENGAKVRWRSSSYVDFAADTNGKAAMQVDFYGFGTLEMAIRSAGNPKKSSVAIMDKDGKYLSASFATGIVEYITEKGPVYVADDALSTSYRSVKFTIPAEGTYTILAVRNVVTTDNQIVACESYTRFNKLQVVDVFDATIDRTIYTLELDTTDVKKDYIAGETELSKEGLTAKFYETHTIDTEKNKTTDITAENLTVNLTEGDLTKLNTTGVVTVTYMANGTAYTKTYSINIKSPVTGVNSVALTAPTYEQATQGGTVTINKEDIVIHKNTADGEAITLGEGESAEYKLYDADDKELASWDVLNGTYTVKATIVLNNTEEAVPGTTKFEASVKVTVKEWVDPSVEVVIPDPITISFNGLTAGDIDSNTALTVAGCPAYLTNVQILANSSKKATVTAVTTEEGQESSVEVDGVDVTKFIKTNGASKATERSIGFTLADGNYTVTVYAKTGSKGVTGRYVQLFDGSNNPKATTSTNDDVSGFSFDVTGGTYQVGGDANIQIFLIVITPKAA